MDTQPTVINKIASSSSSAVPLLVCFLVIFIFGYFAAPFKRIEHYRPRRSVQEKNTNSGRLVEDKCVPAFPFITYHPDENDERKSKKLRTAVNQYRVSASNMLAQLSAQYALAIHTEKQRQLRERTTWPWKSRNRNGPRLLSGSLQERINRLSEIFEQDALVLERDILVPFPATQVLPSARYREDPETTMACNGKESDLNMSSEPAIWFLPHVGSNQRGAKAGEPAVSCDPAKQLPTENLYDDPAQILAHLARDWSSYGIPIRDALYPFVVEALAKYVVATEQPSAILIPGAGLGRLAWEIAFSDAAEQGGWAVEALEASIVMAAAANTMFRTASRDVSADPQTSHGFQLHPFALDYLTNEVDSQHRYDYMTVPDVPASMPRLHGCRSASLSYTVGDFVDPVLRRPNHYAAIVTCFFIDTATNVYEYVDVIQQQLVSGSGVWVNIGPLQWHPNALLQPSADELADIVSSMFNILEWSIDTKPVEYRSSKPSPNAGGGRVRYTHFDAYYPLRFVAQKKK
jgi:N2227-like protein